MATMPQGPAIPITLQQAAASLPTLPISIATNMPISAPPSTPMPVHLPQPPPATDSGEEELPDEDDWSQTPQHRGYVYPPCAPRKAPAPAPTRKSARLATKQAQHPSTPDGNAPDTHAFSTASSRKKQIARASGGADSEGALSNHFVDDDEDFVFHAEFDALILSTAEYAKVNPKSLNDTRYRSDWPLL